MIPRCHLLLMICFAAQQVLISSRLSVAGELSPADEETPLRAVIDEQIAAGWKSRGTSPAQPASDDEFLRRVTLDLTGMIPTADATRAFLADTEPDRRVKLVDQLLDSPQYARHMQHVFDVMLLERLPGGFITDREWEDYLRTSFADNKPWDQIVREILGADGNDPVTRGAVRWLMIRNLGGRPRLVATKISRDIGRMFLGINLQCAECHDHPHISDYKQADFYGLAAFVNRTQIVNVRRNKRGVMLLAENATGDAKFKSVFDPKAGEMLTRPHLPGADELEEPTFEEGDEYEVAPASGVQQIPKYSRRARLVSLLPTPENRQFTGNIANRLWALMFDRGIVHPLDLHHSGNPPSHPELLSILAERFADRQFDMKWFLRELALSDTYQLSSIRPGEQDIPPETYAVAPLKPLRPKQFMFSLMQVSGLIDVERSALGDKATEADLYRKLMVHAEEFEKVYGRPAGQPDTKTDPSMQQALFLANGPLVLDWLQPRDGNLVDRLLRMSEPGSMTEELFLTIFSRLPTHEEEAAVADYLKDRTEDRTLAIQEFVWAMIASSEFRFNH